MPIAKACSWIIVLTVLTLGIPHEVDAALHAGVAKVDVTDRENGPVNDPLFVKALVLRDGDLTVAILTVDAVAIGEIGYISNDYLPKVRAALKTNIGLDPQRILINASHCHGRVCADIDARTVAAVTQATQNLVPVRVGVGRGHENRIMENRRLKLKSGREADVRHAYSLPPDDEVVGAGPIDPDIGLLRLDRLDGRTLAVVYNFACHPIQGVPSGGNTADMTGFASQVLEDSFGDGTVALFLQGCGGDVNPIRYKQVDEPRDAEPLGNQLGLSAMRAAKKVACRDGAPLRWINETLAVPRADNAERIAAVEAEQTRLVQSLKGTSLNLKTFLPLVVKQRLANPFPSYYSHRYLHEQQIQRNDLEKLDAENRRNVEDYIKNIETMEQLTRLQINLALLKKHQARNIAAGSRTLDTEVVGVRVGDFSLVTFPGELTVQIGLNIKQAAKDANTFVAGYTNGYIYYAPTAEQLQNVGGAQEDSDCLLAPEWQALFEAKALDVLRRLK
ncbi:MAG TPA: hypothetical protein VFG20_00250 [Planctomycetaceae bacterium]|nr:hypothetical protein [Planctomycetaceae bacterium]